MQLMLKGTWLLLDGKNKLGRLNPNLSHLLPSYLTSLESQFSYPKIRLILLHKLWLDENKNGYSGTSTYMATVNAS